MILGIPRVIVMPADAPAVKVAATLDYGAEVVLYDRETEDREAIGRALADERGLTVIPPYDHRHVIAGAGTVARELLDEVGELDLLLMPCGGGGLLSGSALACAVAVAALPRDWRRAAGGRRCVTVVPQRTLQTVRNPPTVADGARTPSLGALPFPLIRQHVADMVTVDDRTLLRTMFFIWERLKLVVEPTGRSVPRRCSSAW